jgi:hypothetical protein
MNQSQTDKLPPIPAEINSEAIDKAADSAMPPDREIDASFFSHKSRKSTRLVGSTSTEDTMRARREWLSFDLNEPVYVTSIRVLASGYEEYHEMELSFIDALSGQEMSEKRKFSGSGFAFEPKRFLRGFGLRPDQPWSLLKSQYISRIDVRGIEQRDFGGVVSVYENLLIEKEKIKDHLNLYLDRAKEAESKYQQNRASILDQEDKISTNRKTADDISSEIKRLSVERDDYLKKAEVSGTVEKERNERVQAIGLDIERLNGERKDINQEIVEARSTLSELKSNINLFPAEISGYVRQGTANIKLYTIIGILPMLIIAFVTYRLFSNAERLLSFSLSGSVTDIIKYLLSRSPYVFVSATILGICYSLIRALISEIVNINRKRQELFKISIIATDVSYASQDGMDIDDEQRYALRTQTKIEMLKEHLRMNLGEEFTYSPGNEYLRRIGLAKALVRHSKADEAGGGETEGEAAAE